MNIEIINNLINDSTWSTRDNKAVYRFENGKDVYINNNTHYNYAINYTNDKIVIMLGVTKKYYVNYINDFKLELYNTNEKFTLMPESN